MVFCCIVITDDLVDELFLYQSIKVKFDKMFVFGIFCIYNTVYTSSGMY